MRETLLRSDQFGHRAEEERTSVNDLHAAMLALPGLAHEKLTFFHNGRHLRLTDVSGTVERKILA